jgi:dihydroorotase
LIKIRKPDDWHLHVRDGAMLKASLPFTARHFGRAIIMPNLLPPVVSVKDAEAYRDRVLAARPEGSSFTPLMTCYLTDGTSADEVESGFKNRVFTAVKLYPANATTNSAYGVTDYRKIRKVLQRMEKIGMPLLIHGEEVDPEVDVFDREAVFIERRLQPMLKDFPASRSCSSICPRGSRSISCAARRRSSAAPSRRTTSSSTAPTGSAPACAPTCTACR